MDLGAQLRQKHLLRTVRPQGTNGISPFSCVHDHLCAVRKGLNVVGHTSGQLVQIGHWVSCPFVFSDTVGFNVPQGTRVVCSEVTPGSMSLIEIQNGPFIEHVPSDCIWRRPRVNCDAWYNVSGQLCIFDSNVLVRQVSQTEVKCVSWHLLFLTTYFKPVYKPSQYFEWHDRDYWAKCIDDIHSPANRFEIKLAPVKPCDDCAKMLDGLEAEAPEAVLAPRPRSPPCDQAPAPPLQPSLLPDVLYCLSLDDFNILQ